MSDPQIYDSLGNQITSLANLQELNKNLQPVGYLPVSDNLGKAHSMLSDILKYYNIRRACCLQVQDPKKENNYIIKSLVNAPAGHKFQNTAVGRFYKNANKYDKTLSIPKSLCERTYTNPTGAGCQNFYAVYCSNLIQQYKKINGNLAGFEELRPECGCYIPIPEYIKKAGINAPPVCISPPCNRKKGIFLDQVSADPNADCQVLLCNASTKLSDITGKNVNIDGKITQVCGGTLVTNVNNGFTLSTIPDSITKSLNKTFISQLNNYVGSATTYLSYGIILCSSSIVVIVIMLIIVGIIFLARMR
jgi:hypothetical protein